MYQRDFVWRFENHRYIQFVVTMTQSAKPSPLPNFILIPCYTSESDCT